MLAELWQPLLYFSAVFFYLLTALYVFACLKKTRNSATTINLTGIIFWCAALLLHFAVITQYQTPTGFNLALFNAASIVGLPLAAALLFSCISRPVMALALFVLPVVAIAIVFAALDTHEHIILNTDSIGIRVHIFCAFIAAGILSLAGVQALTIAVQKKRLRKHHFNTSLSTLPPLDAMEKFLIHLLILGFAFLSVSLMSGWLSYDNLLAQHLAHKSFFAMLAWLVFMTLLGGYFFKGWHGDKIISLTLWGFFLLITAYFGSKFVLEFLLQ